MRIAGRGSEWHRWEPHVHALGTVREDRYPASGWDAYLAALETASPPLAAIGITDYCVSRSYENVKSERENGRLRNCSLLFPNIELRLNTGTVKGHFVNIHLLVSPNDPNHILELNRFLGQLVFSAFSDKFVCTPADLIRLGRRADPSNIDDEAALRHGCTQFKVSLDNLIQAHRGMAWAAENIVIAVAGGADGTSGLKDAADATLREEIEKAAQAIFASSLNQRDFWLGHGKASVKELVERYGGLKPCIWGSDAHDLAHVGKPAEERLCWIKGTPTFDALKQACIDPDRAYVGPNAAADKETANRIAAITKRLTEETTALERLREKLKDCRGARTRADTLVTEREQGYTRVFEAVLAEEHVLNELYAPLRMRLEMAGGTLARLSFTVTRVADVAAWAKRGEALFDLRGGPFKGIGSLEKEANTMLLSAWTTGDAAAVSGAITESGSNSEDVQRLQRS
jgi:hypothetical protein